MANTVFKLRRSSVAGKVPNTSTLSIGELAINLTDRLLYSSDGSVIFEIGANTTNSNVSNTLTVRAISANGSNGSAGQVLTTNGTATYWSNVSGGGGFTNGQSISVNNFVVTGSFSANSSNGSLGQVLTSNGAGVYWSTVSGGGGASGSVAEIRQQYTGTGACTVFTVTGGYTPQSLSVFVNGVLYRNGVEVDVGNGSTFTFNSAPANGALIDVIGRGAFFSNNVSTTVTQQFTANGSANSYTITGGYIPNEIMVWVNGVKQLAGVDVVVSSGSTINFPSNVPNNYVIDVFGYATTVLSSPVRQTNTADGVSATYTITGGYIPNQLDVYMNGVKIGPSNANVSSGLSVTFSPVPPNGAELQFVGLTPSNFYSINTSASYLWSNSQTFSGAVTVANTMSVNGGLILTGSPFYENPQTVTSNYTISANNNAMSAGPITINSNVVVTIPSGSVWTIT